MVSDLTPEQIQRVRETVVLVVDDDAMVREIIVEHLKNLGFIRVLEAKNGAFALKVIQDAKARVDLIISDWEMPGMDGLTLLKAVRQNPLRSLVKFIMVTSQVSRERMKIGQAVQFHVDAYIVKPFRGETFKEKVFQIMGLPHYSDNSDEEAG